MATDKKVMKELVRLAQRTPGWSVTFATKHYRFAGPQGLYFAPTTPSDHRTIRNVKAELRRRGLPC